jgi:chaperonin GroEL (HSP60 family)
MTVEAGVATVAATVAAAATEVVAAVEEAAEVEMLGFIRKLTVRKDSCTIIADAGSADEVRSRVAALKKELAECTSTYDSEKISERIAKLSGGVAVIKVGAATEAELEDRKLRIEDAKNATFAAVEEGVVPGGGAALVHLAAMLNDFKKTLVNEELLGCEIVQKAITAPARLIASNAGVEGEVVVRRIADLPWAFGYNAMTDTYEDLLAAGVLDPKKVTRSGLQNACSVAGMVRPAASDVIYTGSPVPRCSPRRRLSRRSRRRR